MSRFRCHCGYTISDVTDERPFAGMVYGDRAWRQQWGAIGESLDLFFKATAAGEREGWIDSTFAVYPFYPRDLPDAHVLSDHIKALLREVQHDALVCRQCGRLWIERQPGSNAWQSYLSEDGPDPDLFNRPRAESSEQTDAEDSP